MTKNQSKELRVKQITEAAVFEFVEKGYEGTSMNSIAHRAKLSKGGLYHYFGSKDEILLEANNKIMEPVIELMEIAGKNKSPVKGLDYFIRKSLNHWSKHADQIQFTFLSLYKILSNQKMWKNMEEYLLFITGFYKELLAAGIKLGELKKHDIDSRAMALASSLDGITLYLIICRDLTSEKVADQIIKTFIDEIRVKR